MASFGQFTDHAPPTEGLLEVQRQLRQLKTLLLQVLLAQHRGESVSLDSSGVLDLLELPPDTPMEEILARLVRAQATVRGTMMCPHCGGAVRDLEGVAQSACPWCGEGIEAEP